MKTCVQCQVSKPHSDFYKQGGSREGFRSKCKTCYNTREPTTPEERARNAAWARDWRKKNPAKNWARYLKGYGTTPEWYNEQLQRQGGVCAVCGKKCSTGKKLAVDHDHRCCPSLPLCGKCNRGLLCRGCNVGIGNLKDDAHIVSAALRYLTSREEL